MRKESKYWVFKATYDIVLKHFLKYDAVGLYWFLLDLLRCMNILNPFYQAKVTEPTRMTGMDVRMWTAAGVAKLVIYGSDRIGVNGEHCNWTLTLPTNGDRNDELEHIPDQWNANASSESSRWVAPKNMIIVRWSLPIRLWPSNYDHDSRKWPTWRECVSEWSHSSIT